MRTPYAIDNETEYTRALDEIARYFLTQPMIGTRAAARFNALATLINAYEAKHWPIEPETYP